MNERDQSNQPESISTTSKVLPWQIDNFAVAIALLVNLTQKKQTLLTLAAAFLALTQAQAQTNNYTGANNGSWNTGTNWSQGSVPTSTQDVFSANGTEVRIGSTTAAVAGNLTIGGSSGTSIVALRNDTSNSLTVGGNITLAPGTGIGQLTLGTGTPNFTSTLTIGGGSGSILDGGGAGASRIAVFGHMGTLGLATATADELNLNQNSSGSLTIGAGQTYMIGTTRVGSVTANVTDALTVNGTLVSTTINPGANVASGANDATFTLNTGGLVQSTTLRRSGSQNITFNWNGGTIQNKSGGNLTVDATSGTLTIGLNGTGTHTFNADSGKTITVASTAVLADQAGQNGTLTKAGLGTLVLQGTNTYTGATVISSGTLQLDGSTASASTVTIETTGTLSGNGTVNGNATLTGGGIINKSSGTIVGKLDVTGGNWNGNGSITGTVTSSSGTFTIGSGANLTANGGMNVTGGTLLAGNASSTITGNLNYTSSNSSTFQGILAGSGKTLKMNATGGMLTLTGNNTYTGTTNVTGGTLLVNGNQSAATGNVNVASGATLGGNGTLAGATTISGILSPGNGNIDTLNIASNVTWKGAASAGSSTDWIFDLGTSNASDLLNITGDFLKDTSLGTNFRFDFGGNTHAGTFKLVDWSGSTGFSASDFSFTNLGGGLTGSFAFNGSQLEFSISAIPESSTWVGMAALVLSAVVMSRHRQRRNIL